jgi:hypothetical protein
MFVGLMDHWVPSHEAISRFWKTPFRTLKPLVEEVCDEMAINNYTFYTKWYSNGLKSSLPFLSNHPEAQNVLTDNDWGRQWIDFLHRRGMTVGAMLQCYTFESGLLPRESLLGSWAGTRKATGLNADDDVVNPTWPKYPSLFEQMLEEELRLFPGLDQYFLEFEGLAGPPIGHALWQLGHPPSKGTTEKAGQTTAEFPPSVLEHWKALGTSAPRDPWLWTAPVQNTLKKSLREHLAIAERVFQRKGFKGVRGVVYHAFGYEVPYILDCLPNRDWWLMPWNYWGWDWCEKDPDAVVRRQIEFCKQSFRQAVQDGYKLCYIGNATLPTIRPETIGEMVRFCREIQADYLGMGDFIPTYGLRWHKATEDSVAALRRLFREELFPRSKQ